MKTAVLSWERLWADSTHSKHEQEEELDDKVLLSTIPEAKDEKGYLFNFFNENMTIIKLKFKNVVIISEKKQKSSVQLNNWMIGNFSTIMSFLLKNY